MSVSHNDLEQLDFQQLSQMSLVKLDVSFNTLKLLPSSKQVPLLYINIVDWLLMDVCVVYIEHKFNKRT